MCLPEITDYRMDVDGFCTDITTSSGTWDLWCVSWYIDYEGLIEYNGFLTEC